MGLKINKLKLIFLVIVSVLFALTVTLVFVNLNNRNQEPPKAGSSIYISDAGTLNSCLHNTSNIYASIYLTNDIDLSGITWKPAGSMEYPFSGELIGWKNYVENAIVTIRNLTIDLSGNYTKLYPTTNDNVYNTFFELNFSKFGRTLPTNRYDGFFGVVNGATIKNIRFENVKYKYANTGTDTVSGNVYFGVLCGRSFGNTIIDRCEVRGLTVEISHKISHSWGFGISGLVGLTKNVYQEYDCYGNVTNVKTIGTNAKSDSSTKISNVVVAGSISVSVSGANIGFYGIAGKDGNWTRSIDDTTARVKLSNVVYWPNLEVSNSAITVYPFGIEENCDITNTCSGPSDLSNLKSLGLLEYKDSSNLRCPFFFNSSISYTSGEFKSQLPGKNVKIWQTVLLTDPLHNVRNSLKIIDNFKGISNIEDNIEDKGNYYWYEIISPCVLECNISSTYTLRTILFGSLQTDFTTLSGYSVTTSQDISDTFMVYTITINPLDVSITFEPPTLAGVYMSGNSSNIKLDPTSSITITLSQSGDVYILTYKFYNKTTSNDQSVVYTISNIYHVNSYYNDLTIGLGETKQLKVQDIGLNTSISPLIQLKEYNINFG